MRYITLTIISVLLFVTTLAIAAQENSAPDQTVTQAMDNYESQTAQPDQQTSESDSVVEEHNVAKAMAKKMFSYEMGFEVYNYKYKETVQGDHFMDLKGVFKGFYARMAWRLNWPEVKDWQDSPNEWQEFIDQLALEARIAFARLDYNGGVSDGMGWEQDLQISDVPDMVTELRLLANKDFIWQGITISPYSGFGFRNLIDDTSDFTATIDYKGTPTEVSGYKRKSYYYYLPLGVTVSKTFANSWYLGMTAEFDQLISGTQKSFIETSNGRVLTNSQNQGHGFRGSIRFAKEFPKFGLMIEPFVRYWDIEDSDWAPIEDCTGPCQGGMEPSNTTTEYGLKAGITF